MKLSDAIQQGSQFVYPKAKTFLEQEPYTSRLRGCALGMAMAARGFTHVDTNRCVGTWPWLTCLLRDDDCPCSHLAISGVTAIAAIIHLFDEHVCCSPFDEHVCCSPLQLQTEPWTLDGLIAWVRRMEARYGQIMRVENWLCDKRATIANGFVLTAYNHEEQAEEVVEELVAI